MNCVVLTSPLELHPHSVIGNCTVRQDKGWLSAIPKGAGSWCLVLPEAEKIEEPPFVANATKT